MFYISNNRECFKNLWIHKYAELTLPEAYPITRKCLNESWNVLKIETKHQWGLLGEMIASLFCAEFKTEEFRMKFLLKTVV